jgi:hypothetical protein
MRTGGDASETVLLTGTSTQRSVTVLSLQPLRRPPWLGTRLFSRMAFNSPTVHPLRLQIWVGVAKQILEPCCPSFTLLPTVEAALKILSTITLVLHSICQI